MSLAREVSGAPSLTADQLSMLARKDPDPLLDSLGMISEEPEERTATHPEVRHVRTLP